MLVEAIWVVEYEGEKYSNGDKFECDKKWGRKKADKGKVRVIEEETKNQNKKESKYTNLDEKDVKELYSMAQELDISGRSKIKKDRKALIKAIEESM